MLTVSIVSSQYISTNEKNDVDAHRNAKAGTGFFLKNMYCFSIATQSSHRSGSVPKATGRDRHRETESETHTQAYIANFTKRTNHYFIPTGTVACSSRRNAEGTSSGLEVRAFASARLAKKRTSLSPSPLRSFSFCSCSSSPFATIGI